MKSIYRPFVWLLVAMMLVGTSPLADGQTKFSTWFRERAGEKKAKDASKAKVDAQWQKQHFDSPQAQQKLVAGVKSLKSKCYVCHLKGKKKEVRNPFGAGLSAALRAQLNMEGKAITAALKKSAPTGDREKVEKAFYECLEKALENPVDPQNDQSGTYGDRLKQGELPYVP